MVTEYIYEGQSGSVRFAPDTAFWITSVAGEGMELTLSEVSDSRQIGTTVTGSKAGGRLVTLTGAIVRDPEASALQLRQAVRPFEPAKLKKIDERGEVWYLEGIAKSLPDIPYAPRVRNFQFGFYAEYPMWRTEEEPVTMLGGYTSSWFPTPVSTSGVFAITSYQDSMDTVITNIGNVETGFELRLEAVAAVNDPGIYNVDTGEQILLNVAMQAEDVIIVSTVPGERGCKLLRGGVMSNAFYMLGLDSDITMALDPGDNVIRLLCGSGRQNLRCTISAPKGVSANV